MFKEIPGRINESWRGEGYALDLPCWVSLERKLTQCGRMCNSFMEDVY